MTNDETVGQYTCIAQNDVGESRLQLSVTNLVSKIVIMNENRQLYSDAFIFEWSCLSGSPVNTIQIEV